MKPRTSPKPSPKSEEQTPVHGLWSGTISFSLVAIPVQLVRAVEPGRVSFRLLHSKDYSPLVRRMLCPGEDRIVPPDEIVRGYELEPEKYLVITDEELESVSPERSRTIEVVEFIDLQDVDAIYYDHPYYLVPLKGGEKAYRLLVQAMQRTNKAGLAKFVLSDREYLVAIKSTGKALALITLHYREEILSDAELLPKESAVDAKEKSRLKSGIKKMVTPFRPEKYADVRRGKIVALLDAKVKAKAMVEAPVAAEIEGEEPVDIVAALQEIMRKEKTKR